VHFSVFLRSCNSVGTFMEAGRSEGTRAEKVRTPFDLSRIDRETL